VQRGAEEVGEPCGDVGASPGAAYLRSKAATVLFGVELDRRLRAAGSPVRSFLAHPGMADTPMHSSAVGAAGRRHVPRSGRRQPAGRRHSLTGRLRSGAGPLPRVVGNRRERLAAAVADGLPSSVGAVPGQVLRSGPFG